MPGFIPTEARGNLMNYYVFYSEHRNLYTYYQSPGYNHVGTKRTVYSEPDRLIVASFLYKNDAINYIDRRNDIITGMPKLLREMQS